MSNSVINLTEEVVVEVKDKSKPWLIVLFTCNLLIGLFLSQVAARELSYDEHHAYQEIVATVTMALLAYIMVGVGYEFDIDKSNLSAYGVDYLVAMTAAGLTRNLRESECSAATPYNWFHS